jgi:hypothetical protein
MSTKAVQEVSSAVSQLMSQLTQQERSQILQTDQHLLQGHIEANLRRYQAVQRFLEKKESYETQCAIVQQQLEAAQRENTRLHAEAEQLFSSMTQKLAEVEPLKKQVEDLNQMKQPGELARRCRDEISRLKGEETKLNQDAAAVGGSSLWHGGEFRCSNYVDQYVELHTRAGLLLKVESTLLSKDPH